MDIKIKLGDYARDRVTGYEGLVTAITDWLYGCRRITLQRQGWDEKNGKPFEAYTTDDPACELVEANEVQNPVQQGGGPERGWQPTRR